MSWLVFFSSRRRHTRLQGDWSQTCALPIWAASRRRVCSWLPDALLDVLWGVPAAVRRLSVAGVPRSSASRSARRAAAPARSGGGGEGGPGGGRGFPPDGREVPARAGAPPGGG